MRISDWSSDMCSSDLSAHPLFFAYRSGLLGSGPIATRRQDVVGVQQALHTGDHVPVGLAALRQVRQEGRADPVRRKAGTTHGLAKRVCAVQRLRMHRLVRQVRAIGEWYGRATVCLKEWMWEVTELWKN